jgi:hypothetical protein
MRLSIFVPVVFLLCGCPNDRSFNPQPVPDSELCSAMCVHLRELNCEEGRPLYDSGRLGPKDVPNKTCEEFCTEQQAQGVFVNPRCVMQVKSCDEIEKSRLKMCQ